MCVWGAGCVCTLSVCVEGGVHNVCVWFGVCMGARVCVFVCVCVLGCARVCGVLCECV